MARITVEDCLEKVENRFHLVRLATKRARQLSLTNTDPFVDWENDKPTVVALREIADGYVSDAMFENDEEARGTGSEEGRLSASFQEEEFHIPHNFETQHLSSEETRSFEDNSESSGYDVDSQE